MNRTLSHLSKLLPPWGSVGEYQARVTSSTASNDEQFDLRDLPSAPAAHNRQAVRHVAQQRVLLNIAGGEPKYIDGSILVRRRDN